MACDRFEAGNSSNIKRFIVDGLDIASAYLGVVLIASLVGFVAAKTRNEKRKGAGYTEDTFARGYSHGFNDGYAQAQGEQQQ